MISNIHLITSRYTESCLKLIFFIALHTLFDRVLHGCILQLTMGFCCREGYASIPQGNLTYLAPELMRTLTKKGSVLSPEERNTEFSNVYAYR